MIVKNILTDLVVESAQPKSKPLKVASEAGSFALLSRWDDRDGSRRDCFSVVDRDHILRSKDRHRSRYCL